MAMSQRSRVRKPESVQFWLCVGAVSLGLHSSLLFGLQRWAEVTIVQPDGGPIAVELMDAPDAVGPSAIRSDVVAPPAEPDAIAQVPQKPEAKPDAQPEVKPEVQPEPEPEIVRKPEPKRESNVPIVPKAEPKKLGTNREGSKPSKPTQNPQKSPNSSKPSPSAPSKVNPNVPVTSNEQLPGENSGNGMRSIGLKFTRPQHAKEPGDPDATLVLTEFPGTLSVSKLFPLKKGQDLDVKVGFPVSCESSTGNLCNAGFAKIGELSITPLVEVPLLASEDIELDTMIRRIFRNVQVSTLTVKTDVIQKPHTFWYVTVKIR